MTPVATHEGVMKLGNVTMRVYRLSDGNTVIHQDDFAAWVRAMLNGSWMITEEDAAVAAKMASGAIDADWRAL